MFQKHIHKVKFYPSAGDLTQALLVTNIMSGSKVEWDIGYFKTITDLLNNV